jgi:U3 small nucleolar RNA-associated protein 5
VSRLASLHKTIDARLAMHDRLLALNGRLELLVSQIDMRREQTKPRSDSAVAEDGDMARYVEGETSDEMEVDEDALEEDEGSVEDVVLGPASDGEESDEEEDEDEGGPRIKKHFMELEAEESGSDVGDDEDEDESEPEGSEMDGFINDDDDEEEEEDESE